MENVNILLYFANRNNKQTLDKDNKTNQNTNNLKNTIMATTYPTNYRVAVEWCNNSFVLCNNLPNIDNSVYDNAEFNWFNEDTEESTEIYQWYITDCSEFDKDFLKNHFGLLFTYSNLLDCYILCVDHYGTSWDYVYCECDFENAKRELGEKR